MIRKFMKSILLLFVLIFGTTSCSNMQLSSRTPSSLKENADMKEYKPFDKEASTAFNALSQIHWSQTMNILGGN